MPYLQQFIGCFKFIIFHTFSTILRMERKGDFAKFRQTFGERLWHFEHHLKLLLVNNYGKFECALQSAGWTGHMYYLFIIEAEYIKCNCKKLPLMKIIYMKNLRGDKDLIKIAQVKVALKQTTMLVQEETIENYELPVKC